MPGMFEPDSLSFKVARNAPTALIALTIGGIAAYIAWQNWRVRLAKGSRKVPDQLEQVLTGVVAANPAAKMPAGAQLHFAPTSISFAPYGGRVGQVPDMTLSNGMVLALAIGGDGVTEVHGSAVMVAPGVALCATHVIEDYVPALMALRSSGLCAGFARRGVQLWRIVHITIDHLTDIAVLGLEYAAALPPDSTFHQAMLSTRLPRVGDRLFCLGFRAGAETFDHAADGSVTVVGTLVASAGNVMQRFYEAGGRDPRTLPFPCLEVDCPTWGGMSGGPVFDGNGLLIGLLSRSIKTGADYGYDPSPTYVSLLWPVFNQRFLGGWPPMDEGGWKTLLSLDRRVCAIDRPEAILSQGEGNARQTQYVVWE